MFTKRKYRIRHYKFDDVDLNFYTAEYKIFGIWMKINSKYIGNFTILSTDVKMKNILDAYDRITIHKTEFQRSKNWTDKVKETVKEL